MSKKSLKQILSNLGSTSTAYGIPCLVRSERFYQRIFWISFILGSSIASFCLIKNDVLEYLDYKVVTTTQTLYEQPSDFPWLL